MPSSFKRLLHKFDQVLGSVVPLAHPAYIEERILVEGVGVYSRDDWSRARRLGYRGAGPESRDLDSNEAYITRMLSGHVYNVHAALRFLQTVNLSGCSSILELGCGEMIQAFIIKCRHQHLSYEASDFDPYIIEKCSRLSILSPIRKSVMDAHELNPENLAGYCLIICWEMLYAFSIDQQVSLLRKLAAARVPFLACTSQLTGPARWTIQLFRGDPLARPAKAEKTQLRMHGSNLSIARYKQLAKRANMELFDYWLPPTGSTQESFAYLLFAPPGHYKHGNPFREQVAF